jgi:hypothetical protein
LYTIIFYYKKNQKYCGIFTKEDGEKRLEQLWRDPEVKWISNADCKTRYECGMIRSRAERQVGGCVLV